MSNTMNPFAALVEEPNIPVCNSEDEFKSKVTQTIEDIFGFTLNKHKRQNLVYLEDVAKAFDSENISIDVLEHALFERILLPNPEDFIESNSSDTCETKVILYLYECYRKVDDVGNEVDAELISSISDLIMRNVATALKQPELYANQDLCAQIYDVLKRVEPLANTFFIEVYKRFLEDEDGLEAMKEPFTTLLKMLHVDIARATPVTFLPVIFNVLNTYSKFEPLALMLLNYCQPKNPDVGAEYANTLLGALLSVSILPKTANGSFEFFQDPLDQSSNASMEGILWTSIQRVLQDTHTLILNLLKCSAEVRSCTLTWLGNCVKANADRGKLWNSQAPDLNPSNSTSVSDGFMINFGALMIKLCQPFCSNFDDGKILKVDPTYCAVPNEDSIKKGIHLLNMSKETCLVPTSESDGNESERLTASSYNFVTECFFMGHRAFDLGFRVNAEKLVRLNQEMSRIERAYHDALSQAGPMTDIVSSIKQRMSSELSKYLSIKCAMSQPNLLEEVFHFISASSFWLSQVAMNDEYSKTSAGFAPLKTKAVTFPLSDKVPDTLKCIPEFVIENIVCYLIFLRRFNPKVFEQQGYERLKPILTFILVYMGSSTHTRNPHLRAHLAEALETLLPYHKDESSNLNSLGGIQRERLFKEHEHRKQIVEILLDVFVGIEMTGQSVQFEQKFNYRRPMYMVMDYMWEMDEYQQYFKQLAEDAERNMEAVSPPLFLRFVNLLINDAIFLLDESFANMAKLREMQTAREKGEWDRLPVQERAQNMGYMQHIAMHARFDNILGKDTIRTLECLTSRITIVFTHNTMVDRVAAMLNYFLLNLVGPNQKNFKVKDQKEYSFDPAATVLDICKIYVNLKESQSFCLAVSQDGRSYSPQLFTLAEDVLVRIGGGPLVSELQEVASKVSEKSAEYQTSEEAMAEAPEQFLDPIMSTLMLDPVILPSSRQTVDRSTIARHLLSDQTDPFNRAPLSMDQIIPNIELASEIQKWLDERKIKR